MITLKMSRDRAIRLSRACEILARLGMQQFGELLDLFGVIDYDKGIEIDHYLKEKIGELRPSEYNGIKSTQVCEEAKIAWDAYQHLRREISWSDKGLDWRKDKRDWHDMNGVCYDEPMKASSLPGDFET